ncbi:helix-turn-helix domain-containing protein [Georgenia sp. EYE_87]|uniref:helix-turn-helix domain-containing protein n=1 Tax=Georgenia sp. EYE_87 TaxID=2853448 RepID=UPI0020057AB3|nr:helix-turn-helix domain-containing protein [Georgenia sp. EYE_87]MCK6210871.1 helix-turn-helix domain-containing protein [Georgenia sp. EYE_87]
MAAQPTLIHSVVRALNLLDAVGAAGGPVPAKRLARTVGLPLATTYHLLRTLVHEGYLARTPDGYVLGERVDALAAGAPPPRRPQEPPRLVALAGGR